MPTLAEKYDTLEEIRDAIFERDRARIVTTLDEFAGRAFAQLSPDTGFHFQYVGDRTSGSYSGFVQHDRIIDLCLERDIPVLDTRPMSFEDRLRIVVHGPMLATSDRDFDDPAFHEGMFSYLPTAAYCAQFTAFGAVLHGEPYDLRWSEIGPRLARRRVGPA